MAATTEQLAQRIHDCGLLTTAQLNAVFADFGTRDITTEEFQNQLLRRGLLSNWQLDRILAQHMTGYFYGDYKVLYIVGAGTFARVYRASKRDDETNLKAVKVLRSRYSSEADTIERFLQEAQVVMKLRHPNIVPIYEIAEEKGRHYMVMDFVEGQNLRDFVKAQKRLQVDLSMKIIRDIAKGLDYAAGQGIAHRDLKLSNVLLASTGRATLVDFGLAAITGADAKASSTHISSPRSIDYAGLERATGVRRDDKRSDIFFLGCMLYQMLSGESPLYETKERIQRLSVTRYREIKPITTFVPDLPHRVVVLLHKLMELNPEQRVQTTSDAVRDIEFVCEAISRGETEAYNEELHDKAGLPKPVEEKEGVNRKVMVIESNVKIQNALREQLKKYGYRVLIFADPRRALLRFDGYVGDEESSIADVVIFGCAQIGPECLEAFNFFGENNETAKIPAILLTDDAQKHFKDNAKLDSHRIHLEMPIKIKQLRRSLKGLIESSPVSDNA